jgi:hypothetical protein
VARGGGGAGPGGCQQLRGSILGVGVVGDSPGRAHDGSWAVGNADEEGRLVIIGAVGGVGEHHEAKVKPMVATASPEGGRSRLLSGRCPR